MKKPKIHSLYVEGIMLPLEISLYHSRKKLLKHLKSRNIEIELLDSPGQTFVVHIDDRDVHFVLIEKMEGKPLWVQLALLAHEASHIADRYFESMGEKPIGKEARAYAVQAACGCLFDAHLTYLEKRKEVKGSGKD